MKIKITAIAMIVAMMLCGCSSTNKIEKTEFLLNTVVTVSIYDSNDENILNGCFDLISHYESLLSRTVEGSDIWNINNAGGKKVDVDPDTCELLKKSIYFSQLSGGVFDVTIAPVSSLWDFTSGENKLPNQKDIQEAVKNVDYRQIQIEGNTVWLSNPNGAIDLGAIAKGYIADKLAQFLSSKGIKSAVINLGGNVYALGDKNGKDWTIGIQLPFQERDKVTAKTYVKNKSIVTSGIYERYFALDGKIYHHILDVKTGYPVQNDLASVTIISDNSCDGDALSTTCFILGKDKGTQLIESLSGIEAIFIDKQGNITSTPGAKYEIVK